MIPDWGDRSPEHATPENVRRWIAAEGAPLAATSGSCGTTASAWTGMADACPARTAPPANRAINALYAVLDDAHVFHDAPKMTDKLRLSGLLARGPGPVKAHFTIDQVAP